MFTPLETRFAVASMGVLGYECNLAEMKPEEVIEEIPAEEIPAEEPAAEEIPVVKIPVEESKEGKNSIKRQRELKLANILRSKVFDGAEMSYIRKAYFRDGVSVQYVHRVYDSIVEMVAEEALRRGLLEQTSA